MSKDRTPSIFMTINQEAQMAVTDDGLICVRQLNVEGAPFIPLCRGDDGSVERFMSYFNRMRIHAS
jgi:hypothetical protein